MGPEPATAECAEIAVLGFVVAGTVNANVNTRAVARYLGGSVALSNLLGATIGSVTPLCCRSAPQDGRPLAGSGTCPASTSAPDTISGLF